VAKNSEINTTDLINWLEGKLDADTAAAVARAVAEQPSLRATADWLREFLHLSATTRLDTPDAAVHRAASAHFRAYARGARRPGLLKTLRGLLVSDSRRLPAPAGARGGTSQTTPRQLIFSTAAADVALNIQTHQEQMTLSGQVFPLGDEEAAVYTVQLIRAGQPIGLATTDAVGKFGFLALQEGQYELALTGDRYEIIIDPLEIAMRAGD
jgi:hypothetical protein